MRPYRGPFVWRFFISSEWKITMENITWAQAKQRGLKTEIQWERESLFVLDGEEPVAVVLWKKDGREIPCDLYSRDQVGDENDVIHEIEDHCFENQWSK